MDNESGNAVYRSLAETSASQLSNTTTLTSTSSDDDIGEWRGRSKDHIAYAMFDLFRKGVPQFDRHLVVLDSRVLARAPGSETADQRNFRNKKKSKFVDHWARSKKQRRVAIG